MTNIQQDNYIQLYDNEAEKLVLGALLLESESYFDVNDLLYPDMFYSKNNQIIYKAIDHMHRNGIPVDILTVSKEITSKNKGFDVVYIAGLTDYIGSSAHILQHAMYIKQEYLKREFFRISNEAIRDLMQGTDIADILTGSINSLNNLEEGSVNTETLKHIKEFASLSIDSAEQRVINYRNGVFNGITTGSPNLDKITGGWQNGDLIIIAARPAMGKTAYAIKTLEAAALSGKNVAMFTLEMKGAKLTDRLILAKTGIEDWKYKQGSLTNEELSVIAETSSYLYSLPVYIDDSSYQTVSRIRSKCRLLKKKNKLDLVIIDYLQLTEGEGKTNSREQEIAKISRELKNMAKALNVPTVALSQLNRETETNAGKRPMLSNIRESGAIEQDADMVCFLHRPEYYEQPMYESKDSNIVVPNGIEFIISKYREGATGSVLMQHDGKVMNIRDYNRFDTSPF